jgi:hypothetical protein
MSQININIGAAPNDGLGAPLRTAFEETNLNFGQVFARAQPNPPATVYGKIGDQAGWYAYSPQYFYYCFRDYSDGTQPIWGELEPLGNISAIQLVNGSSSVVIQSPGSNVNITVGGVANVGQFWTDGFNVNGTASATGSVIGEYVVATANVSALGNVMGTYFFGNGSQLTGLPAYGNSDVANYIATYDGNVSSGNLVVKYDASVAGNITASYVIGNGSQLTGLPQSYSNANVANYLPTYSGQLSGSSLSVAGNVIVDGTANIAGNVTVDYQHRINGTVQGQLLGLVNNVNTAYGTWDFGYIATNTYTNPTQWIFAQTPAGNVNMGTITAPTALNIDIGTIF